MDVAEQFRQVRAAIAAEADRVGHDVSLVAVSKTYDGDHIRPVLELGHRVFGENRVQEAKLKWPPLRAQYPGIELHLIGPLQSNKVADAVALFDVIETVDRRKIAEALAVEMRRQHRHPQLFVQVNTGQEGQKAGLAPHDLEGFIATLRDDFGLNPVGLMCIPPVDDEPSTHFKMLAELARHNQLTQLSMGMSGDFRKAIAAGGTHVRVGSAIFGARG
jgi:PLP dependent protein